MQLLPAAVVAGEGPAVLDIAIRRVALSLLLLSHKWVRNRSAFVKIAFLEAGEQANTGFISGVLLGPVPAECLLGVESIDVVYIRRVHYLNCL